MFYWIRLFWDICRLQKAPQDLPYSLTLLWILLPLAFILDCLGAYLQDPTAGFGRLLLAVMTLTLVGLLGVVSLLLLLRLGSRIVQTFNSMLGTGILFSIVVLPLLLLFDPQQPDAGLEGVLLSLLALWSLMVNAHILRAALGAGFFVSAALVVALFLLQQGIYLQFFPQS